MGLNIYDGAPQLGKCPIMLVAVTPFVFCIVVGLTVMSSRYDGVVHRIEGAEPLKKAGSPPNVSCFDNLRVGR